MLLKRVGGPTPEGRPGESVPLPPNPPQAMPPSGTPAQGTPPPPPFAGNMMNNPTIPGATSVAPPPTSSSMIPGMGMAAIVVDRERLRDFRNQIVNRIQSSIGTNTVLNRDDKTTRELATKFKLVYDQLQLNLSQEQQKILFDEVLAEMVGFGPLEQLLGDESVTEIMVNGPKLIYIEQRGRLLESNITFENDEHVMRIINRIIAPLGRRIDRKSPMVDARLPDGSRVNAVIPPCSIDGPSITIRKFNKKPLTIENLINFGSVTADMAKFFEACVKAHLNIVVSGGTGSGKTTLLNVLSSFIPETERIVTIEDAAELQLMQRHVVRLETKKPEVDGSSEVTIRDLVRNSLRMRPDRIVVGECRGGEALDMLQAMNTGHDGSLTTLHANTPRDATRRVETMCLMAGMDLPLKVIREQMASAIHLIIQQSRLRDGTRRVTAVTEIQGMEGENIVLQDIFMWEEEGDDGNGKVAGSLKPTGLRPKFEPKLSLIGYKLPPSMFGGKLPGSDRNQKK
ncbi:CpaF family protein [Candidatus Chlorohelix sp.]|uniref:CpaF family protein n=1 Tax=Candidatus Chlorohelix sp. TaxID=3139201 RepID=UPI003047A170